MTAKSQERGEPLPVVTALWVYPVKSTRGVAARSESAEPKGVRGDRRWMVLDGSGRFVSRRTHTGLALMRVLPGEDVLTIAAPDGGSVTVPLHPSDERCRVTIWEDPVDAVDAGNEPA